MGFFPFGVFANFSRLDKHSKFYIQPYVWLLFGTARFRMKLWAHSQTLLNRVSPPKNLKATITRCDLSSRFFCTDATLLCEFESDKI